jgi:DNA-directed RNA polymerase subunit N (RpoN/RPB10)
MFPIRCVTCGKVVADKASAWEAHKKTSDSNIEFFEKHKIVRYCCRRMFIGYVDLSSKYLQYCDDK